MKLYIFVALAVFQLIESYAIYDLQQDLIESEWNEFKNKFNKSYKDEKEHNLRRENYLKNRYLIAEHNALVNSPNGLKKPSFKMGLNKYADLSSFEFQKTMNGLRPSLKKSYHTLPVPTFGDEPLPEEIDWRKTGYVSEVMDQGICGACWAFSATGALEGQIYQKNKTKVSLSEQNLLDCTRDYGSEGCNGGLMDHAFRYIRDNKGIDTEESYPYEGLDLECRYDPANKGGEDTGFVDLPEDDEDALLKAVATIGPISVGIDGSPQGFLFYKNGIFDDDNCSKEDVSLGVLVVGYGPGYWLVKNSWGTSWGDEGYIKMARGKNLCGIAKMPSYPLV